MKLCLDEKGTHEHCETVGDYIVCHDCKKTLGRKTEVWARPCGYLRPTDGFNPGKKAEKDFRKDFIVEKV